MQIASGTKNWNEKVLDGYISVGSRFPKQYVIKMKVLTLQHLRAGKITRTTMYMLAALIVEVFLLSGENETDVKELLPM